jgi:putative endonuclease
MPISPKIQNKIKGNKGEAIAVSYLQSKNYKILSTNYRTKQGEIDIIATDDEYIVFVEVKYRTSTEYGEPKEAVNSFKIQKIKNTAISYIQQKNLHNSYFRFDVIEVIKTKELPKASINHIENAFGF